MYYTKFEFKNFKGIDHMVLPLTGGVTTLIGLNESGKTTILEAMFCFSYGAEDLEVINPGMASLRDPEQWIPISQRANFNYPVEVVATLQLEENDQTQLRKYMASEHSLRMAKVPERIEITERYRFENSRHVDTQRLWDLDISGTRGQQRNPRLYGAKSAEWKGAVGFLKGRLPRIWYFPNFLFELPDRFQLSVSSLPAGEEADKSRFYRSTFEQILSQLGSGANIETHLVERAHSSERADQRSLSALLLDMGRAITTTIFEGWDRIFGKRPAAQEVELGVEAEPAGGASLDLKIKGPDGYYDLSERSLGFRWFFMFLLMTSFRKNDPSESKPLFLLDEPASNLHSSAQAELLKSFENLLDRCHLVYTTHSHHLINIRWLDSAYVVKNAALGSLDFADYMSTRMGARTSISAMKYRQFVSENPEQTSYFQPVLDLLDYRPSLLEPVPSVVLVEGKSDFYLIRYVADVLGLETELRFVPGGGAGSLEPLIRLHIGWGKSFLVLLDGDAEGKKQRSRYVEEFGPFLADRCLLLPEACGDDAVTEAEGLLSEQDADNLIRTVFVAGGPQPPKPKSALRQAITELYAAGRAVPLETATVDRFSDLFASLQATM